MASNRREAFEKAKKAHKEQQKNRNFGNFQFEELHYCGLENEKGAAVVRLLGLPASSRELPSDAKLIFASKILGDNGKYFRCIWPDKNEKPNWILWKVYNTVMSRTYHPETKSYTYHHQEKFPRIFNRVAKNDDLENKFETGWYPKKFVIMNVIDRLDPEFHKEQKHSKLLAKNSEFTFATPGISEYTYNIIWDDIVEYNGDWEYYDIILAKLDKEPWYKVYHPVEDKKKLQVDFPDLVDIATTNELTEEEKEYELYDLDKLFNISTYHKIKKNLGLFIQEVDKVFGKHFYEELEELVAEEAKKQEEKKAVTKTQDMNDDEVVDVNNIEPEDNSTPTEALEKSDKKERPSRKQRPVKSEGAENLTLEDLESKYGFKGIGKLTEQEKQWIIGIEIVNGEPILKYAPEAGELYITEGFASPEKFHVCPKSGVEFE